MNKLIVISCVCLWLCVPLYAMERESQRRGFLSYLMKPFVALKNVWGEYPQPPQIAGLTVQQALARCNQVHQQQIDYFVNRSLVIPCVSLLTGYCLHKIRALDVFKIILGNAGSWRGNLSVALGASLAGLIATKMIINAQHLGQNRQLICGLDDMDCFHKGNKDSAIRIEVRNRGIKENALPKYFVVNADTPLTERLVERESRSIDSADDVLTLDRDWLSSLDMKARYKGPQRIVLATVGKTVKQSLLEPLCAKLKEESCSKTSVI